VALERRGGIADRFLVHDRPVARHVDDSVAWCVEGSPRVLRRARGYAPRPLRVERELPVILAVGGHLKNAVALSLGRRVLVSQHIGDMETPQAQEAFERVIADFLAIYETRPSAVAHDLHPDYAPTAWALRAGTPLLEGVSRVPVQHHHAHLVSCLMDNDRQQPALGVTWDGTGYGSDGTIWGGEFLLGDAGGFERVAHLRPFRLPGGDAAAREPRRSALAVLWEMLGAAALDRTALPSLAAFESGELRLLHSMLERDLRCPRTTSAGRLFDAVASLTGLIQQSSFEGHGAMLLEYAAERAVGGAGSDAVRAYRFELRDGDPLVVDWEPALVALLGDLERGTGVERIALRFHLGLVEAMIEVARRVGQSTVALSGGCFQNRLLLERAAARLRESGFEPLIHRRVPPNDGGICLGQLGVAAATLR
jgi:hydrogenase maturation protein HypF